jgi:hypothetical protein
VATLAPLNGASLNLYDRVLKKYTNTYLLRPCAGRNIRVCGYDENRTLARPVTQSVILYKFYILETSKIQLLRKPPAVSSVMDGRTGTAQT